MNQSPNRLLFVLAVGFCFCFAAMLLGSPLAAQSTFGSISGAVTDASGSAVPDAQVTLTSTATSAKQTYTTGGDGLYSFVNLNPGDYRLDVEKAGFKHYKRESVFVQVQQNIRIDVTMEVGAVSQTVEVTAETPLLQPTDTSLGQVVDERKTNEIPLNGRNVFALITLSPAAIAGGSGSGSATGGSQVGPNPFSWGNYQVGGSFGNESAEYIDGQPVNIGYINLPVLIPDQDAIAEFKVQYNNLGPEWGKFAGGVVNLSTKGGTNQFHGEAYEYLRNKVLNSRPYFVSTNPPYVQNQFGGTFGGPVIKDHTFFFFAYDGYRQRASTVFTTTVPTVGERGGVFPADVPIFDPLSVSAACLATPTHTNCARTQFVGNTIPVINPAAAEELKFIAMPTNSNEVNNFTAAGASGGNANQYVGRVDQNLTANQHIFARYNFFNLLDLPLDPFKTGLCADKCAETYQTNALAIDYSYTIRPDLILNINASGSRFHYARTPSNSNFDLTQFGWPAAYNSEIPSGARSPFTPCFTPQDPSVTCSQGQSFIADHDTQVNVSPNLTWIKGRHTWVFGGQLTETYDNYAQTNIASGAFAFDGSWTADNAVSPTAGTGISFADFLLGYGLNQSSVFNHNYGEAQIPALVAQKETYRGFYFGDTWRVTQKLTINYGVRYDLPGNWSVRHDLSTYLDPSATNRSVTGCQQNPATGFGVPGSPCPGDVFFVGTGINPGRTAVPLYKKEFMPRVGVAYSWDQKTVIRAGYGIFFIPNWVLFNLNPSNDPINTSSTLWVATTNSGLSPNSTLTATNCTLTPGVASPASPSGTLNCPTNGPFGPSLNVPLTRQGNVSQFDAGGNPFEAPYRAYSPGYVQQFNVDIQRELPMGIFVDAAYAGSRGVHLSSSNNVSINNIPDSFYQQAAAQVAANPNATPTILTPVPNPFTGITTVSGLNPTTNPTIPAGQLDRPYPEYTGLSLVGDGCCGSNYNSFQLTVTKRFHNGGSFLAAYTNAKLLSNTDTLTTWLETGVGSPQDWNNLKGERSLSSQDVSQRLVISYVYDLPFGHGQRYMSDTSGVVDKVVSGWGVEGVTSFQKGFPLPISFGGSNQISQAGFSQNFQLRPNVTPGCNKGAAHTIAPGTTNNIVWFNASCFTAPAEWGFGDESRVDATLREAGINNWDIAVYKTTNFGPEDKLGLQFRTEFFNAFNRVQFGPPGTALGSGSFGVVSSQLNNPRLIQFGLKFLF
jgi:hypothetical protein